MWSDGGGRESVPTPEEAQLAAPGRCLCGDTLGVPRQNVTPTETPASRETAATSRGRWHLTGHPT